MIAGSHNFSRQDNLVWGRPAAEVVAERVAQAGKVRAFIVTNRSLRDSDILQSLRSSLGERYAGVYSECGAHSPRESVLGGSTAARATDADVLVAVGGGSVIDAAKVMLACLWCDLTTSADLDRLRDGALASLMTPEPGIRMLAIPTTLSAAEFTPLAGITDTARGTKDLFLHPYLVPATVVLDPQATLQTPEWLFASTGIRSIDHCVETLCSSRPSPFADAVAREGLSLLTRGLRAFKHDPASLDTRLDCQLGTWLAISGPVAGVPLGASHAIGRVLGGAFGVPHGHTSCVLLPAVLEWNAGVDGGRQREVARAMDATDQTSAAQAVAALVEHLGQPRTLREVGVRKEAFDLIAEKSMLMLSHPATSGNQRPISSKDQILEILELAY